MAASTIEECDRLLDMINTMLAISKTEAGVEKVSHDKVDIAALIGSACELFEALAEEKNVALRCRAPEKTIVPASREAVCAFMKQNTLRKVYLSLRDGVHEITVAPELAARARVPIERMLQIR